MGGALVFLGLFLLLSQFMDWNPALALLSWWPVLFIILGAEILVFLARSSDKEKQVVKYDFVSIIFISLIGTAGLGMAFLSSTGLIETASRIVHAEVRTLDLPKYEEASLNGIERITVESGPYHLTVESTPAKEVTMFGTYREEVAGDKKTVAKVEDYAMVEKKGDTLYIKLKALPHQRFFSEYGDVETTLLIPAGMKLEVAGHGSGLTAKPRGLQNDWTISEEGYVKIEVPEEIDLAVKASGVQELANGKWENVVKEKDGDDSEYSPQSGNMTFGAGTHILHVKAAQSLRVN